MKKPPIIHPFLFALFPILALYTYNAGVIPISFEELALPIALALAVSLVLYLVLRLLLKNAYKAGLLTSLFMIWFFSYGHITSNLRLHGIWIYDAPFFISSLVLVAAAFTAVIRSRSSYSGPTRFLNIISICLVIYNLAAAGRIYLKASHVDILRPIEALSKPTRLPNIFYIVLDGYARADILSEIYGFDNSPFIKGLEQRGFYVASQSHTAYCQTYLSLASTLNLTYLDKLAAKMGPNSADRGPLIEMIRDSRARHLLKTQGYSFIAFASGYDGTEIRDADLYVHFRRSLSEFQNVLFNTTPLPLFANWSLNVSLYDLHRNRILEIFRTLASFQYDKPPYFVFAHILAPHPPFVFGRDGEPITPSYDYSIKDGSHLHGTTEADIQSYIQSYRSQLSFINQKVIEAVDGILASSQTPPVIILESDHGSKALTDWESADDTYLKETMGVLNAIYLPGGDYRGFYPGISPLNTFILLFNRVLGTGIQPLDNKSYFSTWKNPYDFIPFDEATYKTTVTAIRDRQNRHRTEGRSTGH
jgi:hypothetical protein